MALKEAIKEQIFVRTILDELSHLIGDISARIVYTDSQSAIDLAKDPLYHHRTKHIDIQYSFIREKFQAGISKLTYISTDKQLADSLTKPISQQKMVKFY